ncbi:M20 aminoacylase family protein [Paracoccus luteus]|uniref:M20 aminoacylase family protein n=1 Tax=Paracoccus luteus TaxID=2508543 RepID=UPI001C6FF01A|nr:M20 aminoacylase family protein [Paracoccus luteus]
MTGSTTLDEVAPMKDELVALRRQLHAAPELSGKESATAALVADRLEGWGYEVERGVGGHGVVARLRAGEGNRAISIRADMDALPIAEATGLPYASTNPGVMHACGHDGHTTMLLGAAEHIARTRRFSGTVNLIFQPAEEIGSGALAMIEDGVLERYPCDAIFALHNHPGAPAGSYRMRSGPLMAASDTATVTVRGRGGHASRPHLCIDPVVAASAIVMALQTVVSRSIDPTQTAVVTVGTIHGGSAVNVIPSEVTLEISIRSFSREVRAQLQARLTDLCQQQAASFGATAEVAFDHGNPVVLNTPDETAIALEVVRDVVGAENVAECELIPGSEDFGFFLERKPGCLLRLGNGKDSAMLHNPGYDFNDDSLTAGVAMWSRLVERYLQPGA